MPAKITVTKKRGKAKMKVAEKRKQLMDQMKNDLDFCRESQKSYQKQSRCWASEKS